VVGWSLGSEQVIIIIIIIWGRRRGGGELAETLCRVRDPLFTLFDVEMDNLQDCLREQVNGGYSRAFGIGGRSDQDRL
jgi:hypothetical protein